MDHNYNYQQWKLQDGVQKWFDYMRCIFQLDESTDAIDTGQLVVFICMVFEDGSIKQEFFKLIPKQGRRRGEV